MPGRHLPLTYGASRARFLRTCSEAGVAVDHHPIAAPGPDGEELFIDVAVLGAPGASRWLVVLSGVHGVEAFAPSALQADLVGRRAEDLPDGLGVLVVHVVNPWGMAWGRRQNEANVDLNRNWRRDEVDPPRNEAYAVLHPVACPDAEELPSADDLLVAAAEVVSEHGVEWVRDGITSGQYEFPDGLHFGGTRTEESCRILEGIVTRHLGHADRVVTVDLHTGHGPWAELTALSDQPPGSTQDRFLRSWCDRVEATVGDPEATTGPKVGQIANGLRAILPAATCVATSLELGTADDMEQLVATYHEQWVHRRGDRSVPAHADAAWRYRCCFTPDDRDWEALVLRRGAEHLDRAVAAAASWT